MSKKRFTQGFDSFFGGDDPLEDSFVVEETAVEVKIEPRQQKQKKSTTSKKFATGLESIFMDILEEESKPVRAKKPKKKSFVGLDQLIRSTIDISKIESADKETKRLTILLEIEKIEALRKIAQTEKKRLKNIIRQIVADYLEEKNL